MGDGPLNQPWRYRQPPITLRGLLGQTADLLLPPAQPVVRHTPKTDVPAPDRRGDVPPAAPEPGTGDPS